MLEADPPVPLSIEVPSKVYKKSIVHTQHFFEHIQEISLPHPPELEEDISPERYLVSLDNNRSIVTPVVIGTFSRDPIPES